MAPRLPQLDALPRQWQCSGIRLAALVLVLVLVLVLAAACSLRDPPAATPAPPLPADPPTLVGTVDDECDALLAALKTYQTCPNHEDRERRAVESWIESAERSFAASREVKSEPNVQQTMARACRRATRSIEAAHQRCLAGPRPEEDW